jgi:hypothetical protein
MPRDIPHPTENTHWPSWFYPPETDPDDPSASGRIFHKAEDVPEGWLVHWELHGTNLQREPPPPPEITMSRNELRAELSKRDIPFTSLMSRAELNRLLQEALKDEALDESV